MNEIFERIFENAMQKSEEANPATDADYEQDGLLYCGMCRTPKQTEVFVFGQVRKPFCLCQCAVARKQAEEEERKRFEKMREIERFRRMGFPESDMQNWTFKKDDMENPKLTNAMHKYTENFKEMKKLGKGLLLYGNVGTGKTFAACEVANALIDLGVPVLVTNFARLTNELQSKFEKKQEYIDSLNQFDLLVIDDLGAERKSEYMQEMVYNIIDGRYRSGLPFIITTNLAIEEIKDSQDIGNARIYDRVLERCFPIEVSGASRRRKAVRDTYNDMKDMLGL